MSKLGFDKFINKKSAGKIKEEHRQEKRKSKAALRAAGDEFRRQKLEKQRGGDTGGYRSAQDNENFRGGKSFRERSADNQGDRGGNSRSPQRGANGRFVKATGKSDRDSRNNRDSRNTKDSRGSRDNRDTRSSRDRGDHRDSRSSDRNNSYDRDNRNNRYDNRRNNGPGSEHNDDRGGDRRGGNRFTASDDRQSNPGKYGDRPSRNDYKGNSKGNRDNRDRKSESSFEAKPFNKKVAADEDSMPLNKFIAHSGVCGRREAAELVKLGQVQVNGDIVFEPAIKVTDKDTVKLKGKTLTIQIKHYYFLLNKPKDHITTTKDEKGRRTVLDLFRDVEDAKHLYPVGRLDRNTTGVLLITNDGELAQQLTHPSFEVKKIYEATLDRPVAKKDLESIASGLTLEDGDIKADQVGYPDAKDKSIVGIEIHSGKNRIVRRIFEHLGYEVKKLDRVMFAGLTKKNVERGKWRYLSEKEIRLLKFMNAGGTKKSKKAAAATQLAGEEEAINIPATEDTAPVKKIKSTRTRTKIQADKNPGFNKHAADGGRDRDQAGPLKKQSKRAVFTDKPKAKAKPVGKTTRKEKR